MSLSSFLYAVDGLMAEEKISFHVETDSPFVPEPSPEDTKARNDQAMSAFQAMMGGVQKKKGRRR